MAKNSKDTSKAAAAKEETKKTTDEAKKTTTASKSKTESAEANKKPQENATEAPQSIKNKEECKPSGKEEKTPENKDLPFKEKDLTYEEASGLMSIGAVVKLPEWKGFWFQDMSTGKTFVLTKDNEILDTPDEQCK